MIILKPDAVQRGIIGKVITVFEEKGFKISGLKMFLMDERTFEMLYEDISQKAFYQQTKNYMFSGPCIGIILEGLSAVEQAYNICGCSDLNKTEGWTIRGRFALWTGCDVVHRSDSPEQAEKTIELIFSKDEIINHSKGDEQFMSESAWNIYSKKQEKLCKIKS